MNNQIWISGMVPLELAAQMFVDLGHLRYVCGLCGKTKIFYGQLKWEPSLKRYVCISCDKDF